LFIAAVEFILKEQKINEFVIGVAFTFTCRKCLMGTQPWQLAGVGILCKLMMADKNSIFRLLLNGSCFYK